MAPAEVIEIADWLVPFDDGAIGRAKSAVPLSHAPDLAVLPAILQAYRDRGLAPGLRLPETPGLAEARKLLTDHGFSAHKPTVVEVAEVTRLAAFSDAAVEILRAPDAAWGAVFLGEGFDPVDGAHRVQALSRSPDAAYAAVRRDGRTVAVGVASFGYGWGGIHGMRTAADARGRGHAGAILAALGREVRARGLGRAFLQVEAANPARSLYRKASFAPVWAYDYWTA